MIVISKNGLTLKFNKEIKTRNGFVCGAMLAVMPEKAYPLATVTIADCHRPIDLDQLHEELGHASKALVRKMAKFYGWMLKINLKLARVAPSPSFIKKTQTRKEQDTRQAAVHQHQPC